MWATYRARVERARDAGGGVGGARERVAELIDLALTLVTARWPSSSVRALGEDLRVGLRSLRRAPGYTATSVVILALGIGSATAVFTAFDAVMLDELPVTDPDRIVSLSFEGADAGAATLSPAEVDELGRSSESLQQVAGVRSTGTGPVPLTEGDRSLALNMSQVTAGFFQVLGARPQLGRLLRREDGEAGAAPVTVLSYRTWQREFGGDPEVLSRHLMMTEIQESYAIVGVAQPGLDYPVGTDYWIVAFPLAPLDVVARLAPGVSPEAAGSEVLSIAQILDSRRSSPGSISRATVRPLSEVVLGGSRALLVAITGAVALLLLIACVNVGNLNLMRATGRSRDVMLRRALGATSGGIARLFLAEGMLLGAAGGALGLFCAVGMLRALTALAPVQLPRTEMIGLAGTPLALGVAVTAVAALAFAVVPAFVAARGTPASALRTGGRTGTGTSGRHQFRRTLVVTQMALSVVLLVGAGLLVRSLQRLQALELGYDPDDVAIVELGIDQISLGGLDGTFAMLEGVLERIRRVPGVTAATPVMTRPFDGLMNVWSSRPMLEGRSEADTEANPSFPVEIGGQEFFRAFGIPIVRGRGLLDSDREDATKVVVVSEGVARSLWPGEDPLGKRMRRVFDRMSWWTVVGVAGDTRFRQLLEATPTIYVPWRQLAFPLPVSTVAVRTDEDLADLGPLMRQAIRDFDPGIQLWRLGTLRDHLARGPLAQPRTTALLVSGFGLAALLLVAIGLYGVVALAVRERTHELGVRTALGATSARLLRYIIRDALTLGVTGVAIGLIGALFVSRLFSALLFEVSPSDPLTVLGVCAVLLGVSVIAAYVPAVRATRIDPRQALAAD